MIAIRDGRIWFYNQTEGAGNTIDTLDYELISAYMCPMCDKILDAYFVGTVTEKTLKYYTTRITGDFQIGTVHGGTYIHSITHPDDRYGATRPCKWACATGTGIRNAIAYATKTKPDTIPAALIEAILNNKLLDKGVTISHDICPAQPPLMLVRSDLMKQDEYDDYSTTHEEMITNYFTALIAQYSTEYNVAGIPDMNVLQTATRSHIGKRDVVIPAGQATLF